MVIIKAKELKEDIGMFFITAIERLPKEED